MVVPLAALILLSTTSLAMLSLVVPNFLIMLYAVVLVQAWRRLDHRLYESAEEQTVAARISTYRCLAAPVVESLPCTH